jgi:hypothetical protein
MYRGELTRATLDRAPELVGESSRARLSVESLYIYAARTRIIEGGTPAGGALSRRGLWEGKISRLGKWRFR